MTSKKEWGPHLWKMLHGLVESLGNQPAAFLATDEANEFIFVLRDLDKVMPCALCRSHYLTWRKEHPIEEFNKYRGKELRDVARKWLYELHENVNQRNNISSSITLEDLPSIYKPIDIKSEWTQFIAKIRVSTEIGTIQSVNLLKFQRHIATLRKLVGR